MMRLLRATWSIVGITILLALTVELGARAWVARHKGEDQYRLKADHVRGQPWAAQCFREIDDQVFR